MKKNRKADSMNGEVINVAIDDIIPNRFQPRLNFDEKELKNLADSIKLHGIIQPLILRRLGDKYEIIAGERRFKAAKMAGLTKVPAILREIDDKQSAELAVIENVQRKNLSSLEEAKSYQRILSQSPITQDELASQLGIAQSTLANKLRLLNLCQEVQDALLKNQISERHARSLLSLKSKKNQIKMLDRIIKERLTVKQTDDAIAKLLSDGSDTDDEPGTAQPEEKFVPFDINQLLQKQDAVIDTPKEEMTTFTHSIQSETTPETYESVQPDDEEPTINSEFTSETESLEPTPVFQPTFEDTTPKPVLPVAEEEPTPDNVFEPEDVVKPNLLEPENQVNRQEEEFKEDKTEEVPLKDLLSTSNANFNTTPDFNADIYNSSFSQGVSNSFEDITPNLDNIFASNFSSSPSLEAKPIMEEPKAFGEDKDEMVPNLLEPETKPVENKNSDFDEFESPAYSPLGGPRKNIEPEIKEEKEELEILEPEILDFSSDELSQSKSDTTENEDNDYSDEYDLKSLINKTRDFVDKLKLSGKVIDSEEIDFNDEYQIIIKIKKEDEDLK